MYHLGTCQIFFSPCHYLYIVFGWEDGGWVGTAKSKCYTHYSIKKKLGDFSSNRISCRIFSILVKKDNIQKTYILELYNLTKLKLWNSSKKIKIRLQRQKKYLTAYQQWTPSFVNKYGVYLINNCKVKRPRPDKKIL